MKPLIKLVPIAIVFLLLSGCIEPYTPQLNSDPQDVYVISGEISSVPGYQEVSVSLAASVSKPMYTPVTGCSLIIDDDQGNSFPMEEYANGKYRVWVDGTYLNAGTGYRLRCTSLSGVNIQSDFDVMPEGPEMDTLYYVREEQTDEKGVTIPGIQFYVSFSGSETDSRYYHWSVVETWEYHSPYVIEYYYDGGFHQVDPPDSTYRVCWETQPIDRIFNLATQNLAGNGVRNMPLQFVDNTTTKLFIGYSVLIGQHALSEPAYIYWEKLRMNNESQGGLYERQPLPVDGNLHNLSDPGKPVLGFFQASHLSQQRIFIPQVRDMGIRYDSLCSPTPLGRKLWKEFVRADYPVYYRYFYGPGYRYLRIIDNDCIDCRRLGGSLTKPEFWPE
jgi:hypothetical protein